MDRLPDIRQSTLKSFAFTRDSTDTDRSKLPLSRSTLTEHSENDGAAEAVIKRERKVVGTVNLQQTGPLQHQHLDENLGTR
jgi:hypothetical protein